MQALQTSPQTRRRQRDFAVLMRGRERVRSVLEPHIGPENALERANNITQGLVYEDSRALPVALEMLRQFPCEMRERLATAVQRAWTDEHDAF